ncbi:MAG: hypothetical protein ACREDJ_00260 [Methylocella sp.]
MAGGVELLLNLANEDFAVRLHGIELNLGKSARRAVNFSVPALAQAAHFD